MTRIKAYLWDMDGTLIDSMPSLERLAIYVMKRHFDVTTQEAKDHYENTVGIPFGDQLRKSFPDSDIELAEIEYLRLKVAPTLEAPVFHEVYKGLVELQQDSYVGLVSSTTSELVKKVVKKRFQDLFGYVGGVMPLKDEQIKLALDKFGVRADEAMYIGDTESDKGLAQRLGIQFQKVVNGSLTAIL